MVRKHSWILLFLATGSTTCLAKDCADITNSSERLACYDKRADNLRFHKRYTIFELWKVTVAEGDCGFKIDSDNFKRRLAMDDLTWSDIALAPRLPEEIGKVDDEIAKEQANKSAWCEGAIKQFGPGPDNPGYILLHR